MIVGITGHQELDNDETWSTVDDAIRDIVVRVDPPLVGVSCLAKGADQHFAKVVLLAGGSLYAVLPFQDYERTFSEETDLDTYKELLRRASRIDVVKRKHSDEESFFEAGKQVVRGCEMLVAVWDGEAAAGLGGTGDVVRFALEEKRHVVRIDPSDGSYSDLEALP